MNSVKYGINTGRSDHLPANINSADDLISSIVKGENNQEEKVINLRDNVDEK
jgi:hypothetical protein